MMQLEFTDKENDVGNFYDPDTANGYRTSECVSALQKCVRRGLRDDALYWAVELFVSGQATRAWNRMEIMVSEDIGPANPNLPAVFSALRDSYETTLKKKSEHAPEKLFFVHAVLLLVASPKSRIVDNALIVHFENHAALRRDVPDVALDKHTLRGKRMGRGFAYFFAEGAQLENQVGDDPYATDAAALLTARDA